MTSAIPILDPARLLPWRTEWHSLESIGLADVGIRRCYVDGCDALAVVCATHKIYGRVQSCARCNPMRCDYAVVMGHAATTTSRAWLPEQADDTRDDGDAVLTPRPIPRRPSPSVANAF